MSCHSQSHPSSFTTSCFHPLNTDVEQPLRLNNPFRYQPHPLALLAIKHVQAYISGMQTWQEEVAKGKMFGVLVVENQQQQLGFLAAYSGQIEGKSDWSGFVPAVFDYLQPQGYFKKHEEQITHINALVEQEETDAGYLTLKKELKCLEEEAQQALAAFQNRMKVAKRNRDHLRQISSLSAEKEAELIRESQFMKAELRRIKHRWEAVLADKRAELAQHDERIRRLKDQRKQQSDALQRWLFTHFVMLNAQGEQRNLLDIFAETPQHVPPAGAGECCAPKLLQYAYQHHYKPITMAEFWWGASPKATIRHHGACYPACRGKCLPILRFMLQGLEVDDEYPDDAEPMQLQVVYEDDDLVVVNKPAGLLSVPGRSSRPSVLSILREIMPQDMPLHAVHRLDMATSGLLIVAKNMKVYHHLQAHFKAHTIQKEYIAVLDGKVTQTDGSINLPLRPDLLDRPRQIVDCVHGKPAVTFYRVLSVHQGKTLLVLSPKTGRTHQLRMHCAHQEGLNCPILGDELYGHQADRLYLHAASITFIHPTSGKHMTLKAPIPDCFNNVK